MALTLEEDPTVIGTDVSGTPVTDSRPRYEVLYAYDGHLTRIGFRYDGEDPVTMGAGILFLHDCCPGEDWVVLDSDGNVVEPVRTKHHYYGWTDSFDDCEED